jgi:hypothetical protein
MPNLPLPIVGQISDVENRKFDDEALIACFSENFGYGANATVYLRSSAGHFRLLEQATSVAYAAAEWPEADCVIVLVPVPLAFFVCKAYIYQADGITLDDLIHGRRPMKSSKPGTASPPSEKHIKPIAPRLPPVPVVQSTSLGDSTVVIGLSGIPHQPIRRGLPAVIPPPWRRLRPIRSSPGNGLY